MRCPGLAAAMLAAVTLSMTPVDADAQADYPNKPIRFVVPAATGGPTEITARLIGQKMQETLGQPVIIDARPGAGGNLGADLVAKAAPDGYTILMATIGTHAVNQTLYKKLPFDPTRDFAPVSQVVQYPLILVVNPKLPVNNVRELIAYAKKNPGKLNRASGGSGTSMHLSGELFRAQAGIDMPHIPYKGSAPALTDLIGGQVDLMFDSMITALPQVQSGKLRALAVTGGKRSPAVPEIPTVAESGLPGYSAVGWIGVIAPAGTPQPVIAKLNDAIVKALNNPEVRATLIAQAAESVGSSPWSSRRSCNPNPPSGRKRSALPALRRTDMQSMASIDFKARVQSLAAAVDAAGLVAYVGTRQAALHWLSGAFMPWRGAVIVTARGDGDFVYWAMDAERVRTESWGATVHEFQFDGFIMAIAELLAAKGCGKARLGLDLRHPGAAQVAPGMLTAAEYHDLSTVLSAAALVNAADVIDDLMLIKSPAEIERLKRAAAVSELGFRAGVDAIREGVTENFVAGQIEAAIRLHGSNWSWAVTGGTEVGAGERCAFARGLTQQATGRRIADCAADGVKVFARHGLADHGLPLFGHGLGTCARTRPFINSRSTDVVQPGMVAALGTHLYQPGVGGCRLEYPVLIDDAGAQPLVNLPPRVHVIAAR